jgi:hypothetical protein
MDGCYNRRCGALSRLVRARGKTLHDVCSPRLAVECNSAAGDRPTKSPAKFKSLSKLSKAVWSIYAIALSLGLYSSLLFFLVAFAHGIYVIRTENRRFSKTLIAYLLASEAATIIWDAGILV